ncbi:MAG: tRNA pseudouridine synthase A [Chlamydiales bacterium]|nr:tRNA pseudouridine synthase A [Chlamydiales bacterium]MCH9635942.1 tRNA pseudouridine synthase A [Chlamydiales bacterium]MCH9704468.1 tRNA pseudouridine(38-40) synthase TruA [Chlamydiota bacterium]
MRYKIQVAYDGGHFSGWQVQPNASSVQAEIERALLLLTKQKVRVIGSGRTDAGAHARGQVAHFDCDQEPSLLALCGILPKEIRILSIEPVEESFHAQYGAKSKIYYYHLWLDQVSDPLLYKYRYKVPFSICLEKLKEAAALFVGRQDFKSFCNAGSSVKTTVRTLKRIDIVKQRGGVRLEFEGNGFLYKMVRNIVGTLLEVASGKEIDIAKLLEAKDRREAGACAPAHGLFLMEVNYENSSHGQKCQEASQSPQLAAQR